MKKFFKLATDSHFGFKYLDPIPSQELLNDFYKKKYYRLSRAPQIKRFMKGGLVAQREKDWYAKALWTDVRDTLKNWVHRKQKRLLDVGAGTGDFANFMAKAGWDVAAVEPSLAAAQKAKNVGVTIYPSLEHFQVEHKKVFFDALTFLNVLEHVPHPVAFLKEKTAILKKGGVVVIQIPNDFSPLQLLAQKKYKTEPWWVFAPDHCNYFNFNSMTKVLRYLNFEILDCLSDFPMEFFLLFGDNYINNATVGSECHARRVRFDTILPPELKRRIYKSLSRLGVGRNLLLFARKGSK
ncbi:MAG: class I SAM-dependent methyltransferase [Candidatus Omnitrophota bacterium]|jgi:2-polyprenyl-3-methyl-5-hydroxy-6-metoxy-1,4-benzoquinol methylase